MAEKNIHKRIAKAIRKEWQSAWTFKVHGGPFQPAGIPDLICCIKGRFVAIEVKLPGLEEDGLSYIQADTIEEILEAGGIAGVASSVEEAIQLVIDQW